MTPVSVDDDAALRAFHRLSKLEGIIPALESSHAVAYLDRGPTRRGRVERTWPARRRRRWHLVIVNVSGRGDKDLDTVIEESEKRGIDASTEHGGVPMKRRSDLESALRRRTGAVPYVVAGDPAIEEPNEYVERSSAAARTSSNSVCRSRNPSRRGRPSSGPSQRALDGGMTPRRYLELVRELTDG